MIVSPPFLPARAATTQDDAWVAAAMPQPESRLRSTQAREGSYPLSNNLEWHNGIHLQGQAAEDGRTPVRAIADGNVVFVAQPKQANNEPADAQNFNPFGDAPSWTDNGLVILRHETEIGAAGDQPTTLVYYSAYMHLNEIGRAASSGTTASKLKIGDAVWRKDVVGYAGQIYGHAGQVHLEICLDQDNLTRLIGRSPAWVDPKNIATPTADGRTDAVFGAIWFYLPAGTPTHAATAMPTRHLRVENSPTTLEQALWVEMTYSAGRCTFTTYDTTGRRIGTLQPHADSEYALYTAATTRHGALPETERARSSPSGWYELLRFGRNLGRGPNAADKDPLSANAAHWRRILGADGQAVWADLNAEGSFKFSDADFLPIAGWNFIDDDATPDDQRCDSDRLKNLIADPDPQAENRLATDTLARRLGDPEVMRTLRRTICRFPCEWNQADVATRYAFVKELPEFQAAPEAWSAQEKHFKDLSFANLPQEYLNAQWHVHPTEFIVTMRKCGWLSRPEMRQLVPSHSLRTGSYRDAAGARHPGTFWERNPDPTLIETHQRPLNRIMRKYGINTPIRMAGFFGNSIQETGWFRALQETGGSGYWYSPWYGRGFLQLTHPGNYIGYWRWRGRTVPTTLETALNAASARAHTANSNVGLDDRHFPALTTEMVDWRIATSSGLEPATQENFVAPSDSAGYYWAKTSMARYADDSDTREMERVVVATVDTRGRSTGNKVYYRSQNFWQVSAAVNLPGRINNTNYRGLNGFDSRCCAWGVALAILTEYRFPDTQGNAVLDYPEGYVKVRP